MIYTRNDGTFIIQVNSMPYQVIESDITKWAEVQQRLLDGEATEQYIPPSPNPSYIWNSETEMWEPDLVEQKLNYQERITTARIKKLDTGFTFNTYSIKADQVSQDNANGFLTANQLGLVTFPIAWRTVDNLMMSIADSTELITFTSTMLGFVQGIFQDSWDVKDAIELATTIEEVQTLYAGY
jgi:hypothetical protein